MLPLAVGHRWAPPIAGLPGNGCRRPCRDGLRGCNDTCSEIEKYADPGLEIEVGKTILDLDLSFNGANALTAERRSVS
jgi:hypothetical protein